MSAQNKKLHLRIKSMPDKLSFNRNLRIFVS
jgi:hypothetical protein